MDYRVKGLSPEPFLGLYGLSDAALAERTATFSNEVPDMLKLRSLVVMPRVWSARELLVTRHVPKCL